MAERIGWCGPISCSVVGGNGRRECGESIKGQVQASVMLPGCADLDVDFLWPIDDDFCRAGQREILQQRRNNSRTIVSCASRSMGMQFIDGAEIQIPRDEDGPPVALVLVERRFDVDGGLQHDFRHAVSRRGGMLIDPQTLRAPAAGLSPWQSQCASCTIERRKAAPEPVPPMIVHDPARPEVPKASAAGELRLMTTPVRGLHPRPEEKEPPLSLGHRRRIFADRFRATIEEHDAAVIAIDIGC